MKATTPTKTELRQTIHRLERERRGAIYWLLRAYHSGHREGWEMSLSVDETMNGLWTWLCNRGYDPNTGPARRIFRRKREPR